MKIGIMTMYHDNYNFGGQLQAMALQEAITQLGYESLVIDYVVDKSKDSVRKVFHTNIKDLFFKVKRKFLYKFKIKVDVSFSKNIALREKKFQRFMDSIPHTEECNSNNVHELYGDVFDILITGSDQVWNPNWWDSAYFLDFASPETKKIAYAVSLDVNQLSEKDAEYIREKTLDFEKISLREIGSKKLLADIIDKPLHVTLDPTLLFQKDFWDTVAIKPDIDRPYVLIYFPRGKG